MHEIITEGDFAAGFEVGYRAIKGQSTAMPATPAAPATRAGSTRFLEGVRAGLRRAGVTLP